MTSFETLGLSQYLLNTLSANDFNTPTPIQAQAIPHLMEGRDLMGLAQTGTGKTLGFGLPIIARLIREGAKADPKSARALILAPTRELVNQIAQSLLVFTKKSPLKQTAIVGGASINKQAQILEKGVDILVATPGRLLDLCNRRALNLTATRYLVLDEADQMLDLGFIHDLKKIVKLVPKRRQTMLFSATMPQSIAELASEYLVDPIEVSVTPPGTTADRIEQKVHFVTGRDQKANLLKDELRANADGLSLIFCKTKHGAEKLMKHLAHSGFSVASIHGNKSQGQRDRALKSFRDGETRILVATDVAARGIDVPGVSHVYNYDLPTVPESYVHRIGRTARAGREGVAIAFCGTEDLKQLYDIEKLTGVKIPVASGERPEWQGKKKGGEGHRGRRETSRGPREEKEKALARQQERRHEPLLKTSSFAEVGELEDVDFSERTERKRQERSAPRPAPARNKPEGRDNRKFGERREHTDTRENNAARPEGRRNGENRFENGSRQRDKRPGDSQSASGDRRNAAKNNPASAHRHSPAARFSGYADESNVIETPRSQGERSERAPRDQNRRPSREFEPGGRSGRFHKNGKGGEAAGERNANRPEQRRQRDHRS